MNDRRADGYIAAGVFLVVGLIVTYYAIFQMKDELSTIVGIIISVLGLLGIKFPQVGEVLFRYLRNISSDSQTQTKKVSKNRQYQRGTRNSSQTSFNNARNVTIINNNSSRRSSYRKPSKRRSRR